jgi:glutamyl-tRNA reductase
VPLLIVNRSAESAAELAGSVAAEWLSLDEFRSGPPPSDALVLAAGGGQPLLDEGVLMHLRQGDAVPGLVIDFGVPPNVEPEAARRAGWQRLGMDELIAAAQEQRLAQLVRLAPVRAAIDERLARLRGELATRAIGARLAGLKGDFEQIAAEAVARALRRELRTLDARERLQLERVASGLARRLAHLPLAGLRAAAVQAGPEAVEAFFDAAKSGRPRADGKPT